MDDGTYSDQQVVEKSKFYPDPGGYGSTAGYHYRYIWGWPTTAFLTPEGDVIAGGTYIPPEEMLEMISGVRRLYRQDPAGIDREMPAGDDVEFAQSGPPPKMETKKRKIGMETETFADLIGFTADQIKENYDSRYGGFGNFPKFPMFEALELAQVACLYQEGDQQWEKIFTHTLRSMFTGGIYDSVEGGFFRYSTTRDRASHYEKMLEDNA